MPFGTLGVAHAFFYPKRRQFNLNTLRDTFVGKSVFFAYLYMGVPTLGSYRTVFCLSPIFFHELPLHFASH